MKYKNIEGWFDFADIYDHAVSTAKDGDILIETGTWLGKSACYLAEISVGKNLNLFTIDNNREYAGIDKGTTDRTKAIKENLKGLKIKFIDGDSLKEAAKFKDGSVHMIFLDALHEYDFLCKELRAWYPKLKPGGIFAGHDHIAEFPGVIRAVKEFAAEHNLTVNQIGSSWKLT